MRARTAGSEPPEADELPAEADPLDRLTALELAALREYSPDEPRTVREIAEIMRERNVGSVVLVEGDRPVGFVTDRDLALSVIADGRDFGDHAADHASSPVITADPDMEATVRSLRSHAMTSVTWDRHRGYAQSYDVVDVGYNFRMDEPRAALGLSRLPRLAGEVERVPEQARGLHDAEAPLA